MKAILQKNLTLGSSLANDLSRGVPYSVFLILMFPLSRDMLTAWEVSIGFLLSVFRVLHISSQKSPEPNTCTQKLAVVKVHQLLWTP